MRHYFIARNHSRDEYFTFNETFRGQNFTFKSCSDVFSKNELDYGSLVLVNTIVNQKERFAGKIMDMCCGYGTIAILLSKFIDGEFFLSDVNSTATDLAKQNIKLNKCNILDENIYTGNMFENIDDVFNHVVSNPPIKAGKKYLLDFVDGAFEHLVKGGTLTLVIKKNLGADSLKKYLTELFGNCEVLQRDKGFYILHCIK